MLFNLLHRRSQNGGGAAASRKDLSLRGINRHHRSLLGGKDCHDLLYVLAFTFFACIVGGLSFSSSYLFFQSLQAGGRPSEHFTCKSSGTDPSQAMAREYLGPNDAAAMGDVVPWKNCHLSESAGGPGSDGGDYPLCGVCVERSTQRGEPPLDVCRDYDMLAKLDSVEHPPLTVLANRDSGEVAEEAAERKIEAKVKQLEEGIDKVTEEKSSGSLPTWRSSRRKGGRPGTRKKKRKEMRTPKKRRRKMKALEA